MLQGRAPTEDDLPKLAFTRRAIDETMRLYPSVPIGLKTAVAKDQLCGHTVPKGAFVVVSSWIVHRHNALWENADSFDPDRFLPERSAARHRFAFLPFLAGPRTCPAAAWARAEITTLVAILGQRLRFRLVPGHRVAPIGGAMILRFDGPMLMRVEPRGTPG